MEQSDVISSLMSQLKLDVVLQLLGNKLTLDVMSSVMMILRLMHLLQFTCKGQTVKK